MDRFNLYLLLTMKNVKFFALLLCAVLLVGCSSLLGENNDDPSVKPEDVGYFSIEIDDVSAHSATVSVTASDNLPADWIWDVAESDEVINEEYVEAYLLEYYAVQLEQFGATEAEYPFSKFLLEVDTGRSWGGDANELHRSSLPPPPYYDKNRSAAECRLARIGILRTMESGLAMSPGCFVFRRDPRRFCTYPQKGVCRNESVFLCYKRLNGFVKNRISDKYASGK